MYICKKVQEMRSLPELDKVSIIENPRGDISDLLSSCGKANLSVLFIANGYFDCTINHLHYFISPATLAVMPGVSFIGKACTSDNFKGYLISIDYDFLDELYRGSTSLINWRKEDNVRIIHLDKKEIRSFKLLVNMIQDIMQSNDSSINKETFNLQIKSISCKVLDLFNNTATGEKSDLSSSRKDELSKKFIDMVHTYGTSQRDLAFYADKLCMTPKYLSSVVSKTTGKKAKKWIEDFIMSQSMHMLKSTRLNISQISYYLNFESPSDFCRYFHKCAGMTPRQYRKLPCPKY